VAAAVAFGFAVSPGNNPQSGRPLIDVMPCKKFVSGTLKHWRFRAEQTRTVRAEQTTQSRSALTCPGRQRLGPFSVHGSDEQIFGAAEATGPMPSALAQSNKSLA
jgi:hypothetical protein